MYKSSNNKPFAKITLFSCFLIGIVGAGNLFSKDQYFGSSCIFLFAVFTLYGATCQQTIIVETNELIIKEFRWLKQKKEFVIPFQEIAKIISRKTYLSYKEFLIDRKDEPQARKVRLHTQGHFGLEDALKKKASVFNFTIQEN